MPTLTKRQFFLFLFLLCPRLGCVRTLLMFGCPYLPVRFSTWWASTAKTANRATLSVCLHFFSLRKQNNEHDFLSFLASVGLKSSVCNRLCFCDYSFTFFIDKDRSHTCFGRMGSPENERWACFFLAVVLLFLWMHYSAAARPSALAPPRRIQHICTFSSLPPCF